MKFCFLSPFSKETGTYYKSICHGIGIMAAIASKYHEVEVIAFSKIEEISNISADYVLISSYSNQMKLVKDSIQKLSKKGIKCIVGGMHATFSPEDFIDIDYHILVRGEGELFIKALMESENDALSLPGVFKKGEKIKREYTPIIKDLDTLPFTLRYLFPTKKARNIMGFEVMTGRGCHYNCTYCSTPALRKIYPGYIRQRSPENVIKEICDNSEGFPIIGFHDDHFLMNKKWLSKFLILYKKYVNKPFWCNSRVEAIDEEIILKLKNAGLKRIHMGVECAGYERRKKLLNRNITDDEIINAFYLCKKNGIKTLSFNMIGLPDEDEKKIMELIKLNRIIDPEWIHVSIFQPYPGVALNKYCKDKSIDIPYTEHYYTLGTKDYLDGISGERLGYFLKNFVSLVKDKEN